MKPVDQARRFLSLADRDIKAFQVLKSAPEVSIVTVCFHAHQAVEKSLKAVLILHGVDFRKTHDLNQLAHLLLSNEIKPPVTPEQLTLLNPYAVTFRYDDMEIETITPDEAEIMTETVRRWAGEQIESETPSRKT